MTTNPNCFLKLSERGEWKSFKAAKIPTDFAKDLVTQKLSLTLQKT